MGAADAVSQKIKGKVNKAKGRVKEQSPDLGDKISGAYDEAKGSVQDTIANARLHNDNDDSR